MTDKEPETPGTLKLGEFHPAASSAMAYIQNLPFLEKNVWLESFASNAIEGNRLAEICSETLDRVLKGDKVSDRYLLGLAWTIASMKEVEVKMIDGWKYIKHEGDTYIRIGDAAEGITEAIKLAVKEKHGK